MARRFRHICAAFVALGACAPQATVSPNAPIPYRNPTAPVASVAVLSAPEIEGMWRVISAYPDPFGCDPDRISLASDALQLACFGDQSLTFAMSYSGQGRFVITDPQRPENPLSLWALWVDFTKETMVLADPNGRFGWILNRSSTPSADRLQAARDILNFYGYDLARLVEVNR